MSQKTNALLEAIIMINQKKHNPLSKKSRKLLTMTAFKEYEKACRIEDWHTQKQINKFLSL